VVRPAISCKTDRVAAGPARANDQLNCRRLDDLLGPVVGRPALAHQELVHQELVHQALAHRVRAHRVRVRRAPVRRALAHRAPAHRWPDIVRGTDHRALDLQATGLRASDHLATDRPVIGRLAPAIYLFMGEATGGDILIGIGAGTMRIGTGGPGRLRAPSPDG